MNRSLSQTHSFELEAKSFHGFDLLSGDRFDCSDGQLRGVIWPMQAKLISFLNEEEQERKIEKIF